MLQWQLLLHVYVILFERNMCNIVLYESQGTKVIRKFPVPQEMNFHLDQGLRDVISEAYQLHERNVGFFKRSPGHSQQYLYV